MPVGVALYDARAISLKRVHGHAFARPVFGKYLRRVRQRSVDGAHRIISSHSVCSRTLLSSLPSKSFFSSLLDLMDVFLFWGGILSPLYEVSELVVATAHWGLVFDRVSKLGKRVYVLAAVVGKVEKNYPSLDGSIRLYCYGSSYSNPLLEDYHSLTGLVVFELCPPKALDYDLHGFSSVVAERSLHLLLAGLGTTEAPIRIANACICGLGVYIRMRQYQGDEAHAFYMDTLGREAFGIKYVL